MSDSLRPESARRWGKKDYRKYLTTVLGLPDPESGAIFSVNSEDYNHIARINVFNNVCLCFELLENNAWLDESAKQQTRAFRGKYQKISEHNLGAPITQKEIKELREIVSFVVEKLNQD